MTSFLLICALLSVVACLFIVLPALKYSKETEAAGVSDDTYNAKSRMEENVRIYKESVKDLEHEFNSGKISEQEFESLKAELDNSLLDDANQALPEEHKSKSNTLLISLMCSATLIVLSVFTYAKYGAYEDVVDGQARAEISAATDKAKNGDITDLLQQLHTKLKENPNNLEGWSLLARSAMNTERYSLAIESFKNIVRLLKEQETPSSDVAAALGLLAQAQYYQAKGVLTPEISQTIDQALVLEPKELNAYGLLAIDAFTNGNYQKAIDLWQEIIELSPNHPARQSMEGGIQEAKKRLNITSETKSNNQPDITDAGVNIGVYVDIDPALKSQVNDQAIVFVIVKNGSPNNGRPDVPLAASRHRVSELPIQVSLSDRDSMAPIAKLSDAKTVNVIARVSLSGNPIASSGDFQGEKLGVELKQGAQASITIDHIVE